MPMEKVRQNSILNNYFLACKFQPVFLFFIPFSPVSVSNLSVKTVDIQPTANIQTANTELRSINKMRFI